MGTARVITMTARPRTVAYLGFEIGGILDTRPVDLGDTVPDIPWEKLTDLVKEANVNPGDPSRLGADGQAIRNLANSFALATLRNEDRRAILDSAVNSRQNVYFSKYANAGFVISTIRGYYSRTSPASKPNRLQTLSDLAQQQAMDLQQAYDEDEVGVVRSTTSFLESATRNRGGGDRGSSFIQESVGRYAPKGSRIPHLLPAPWEGYEAMRFTANGSDAAPLTVGRTYEQSREHGSSSGTQSATHVDHEYRTPNLEARARNHRAQISLMDQRFESYLLEQNMPHLETIFANELASLDNDVYQLQVALLRSFLTSPVAGVVTGVYKNPGEPVDAGEPVLRVEDHRRVRLVGSLVHHGPVALGAAATVVTTLSGAAGPVTTMTGTVVAARGTGDGARWEVVVDAPNVDGAGNPILPLDWTFDAEFTQVTLS
ncbi:HlyD family efflux transporter periplasmic adaptor subunit [Tersicoccus sp. Bi-70]|uniref:HlyD family efflux transporter periplasmic adaptor subunit n=1 Tax=Tersicoccus sp. Bi-70 TaxID=1897634 RepID=UPI000976D683|nr:HlyD family secretion protein [Tersicoccus sp. Bi-70]OMH34853.1 hypothetical protein BGP79_00285 [Tersicoccus sp. Bi-70]